MTEQEKNFNKWFDEYNIEKIKVFEEPDLKMAYLQGRDDEAKAKEESIFRLRNALKISEYNNKAKLELNNNQFKMILEYRKEAVDIIKKLLSALRTCGRNNDGLIEQAENFIDGIEI